MPYQFVGSSESPNLTEVGGQAGRQPCKLHVRLFQLSPGSDLVTNTKAPHPQPVFAAIETKRRLA